LNILIILWPDGCGNHL